MHTWRFGTTRSSSRLAELAEADEEVFGEVMALLTALEQHGRDLEAEARDESHPIVTAR